MGPVPLPLPPQTSQTSLWVHICDIFTLLVTTCRLFTKRDNELRTQLEQSRTKVSVRDSLVFNLLLDLRTIRWKVKYEIIWIIQPFSLVIYKRYKYLSFVYVGPYGGCRYRTYMTQLGLVTYLYFISVKPFKVRKIWLTPDIGNCVSVCLTVCACVCRGRRVGFIFVYP